jgi:hypothetical protein
MSSPLAPLHPPPAEPARARLRRAWRLAPLLALLPGCVTVYQPLRALQRPAAVDPRLGNFEGVRLHVRCFPGEALDASDAEGLCRKVGALFRTQGAEVDARVPRGGGGLLGEAGEAPPDLVVDVRSRLLHTRDSPLLWALSFATFTLVPAVTESSFAQDVSVRDRDGALLASDSLQARFVRYFGAGVWASNWVLDVAVRPPEDDLTGDVANRDFSRDFYAQLSQLAFNARVRSQVLRNFAPPPARTPPAGAPPARPAAGSTAAP